MKEARIVDAQRDAWQKHALEIALHNRRQSVEPHWKYENQRLGGPQARNVRFRLRVY